MEIESLTRINEYLVRVTPRVYMFEADKYPGNVQVANERKGEELRLCPTCELVGEPNSKWTFYWNYNKQTGICHRCHCKFIPYSNKSKEELELELTIRGWISHSDKQIVRSLASVPEIQYERMFDPPSDFCKEYLASRNPLLQGMEDYLQIRELKGVGVAAPMYFKGKIISYTMRLYEPVGKKKYHIPPGDKYIYSPNRALKTSLYGGMTKFSLCEGMFDSFAMLLLGYDNPLAVQGSFLTDTQARMMSQFFPEEGQIFLDSTDLSFELRNSVRQKVKSIRQLRVVYSDGEDPEELLIRKLQNGTDEFIQSVLDRREKLICNMTSKESSIA